VPGIVGFGRAAELALGFVRDAVARTRVAELRDRLEGGILERVEGSRANGAGATRVGNTTNVSFAGLEAEALLGSFSSVGLYASAGSACHARARKVSHVLIAMGLGEERAAGCVRFSLSRYTGEDEVEAALGVVVESAAALRG
jgi:cysteine desulfurase